MLTLNATTNEAEIAGVDVTNYKNYKNLRHLLRHDRDIRHTPFETAGDRAIYHSICLPFRIEKSLFHYDGT